VGNHRLYPEADCLQPTLRSRFRQRLTASVDMTSDIKGWEPLFEVFIVSLYLCALEEPEPVMTTVDLADIRGLGTTFLASVG
jgi:hypothetical protein